MSLVDKVAALRNFLGVPSELELLPAVASMNAVMGIDGEGPLPQQVCRFLGSERAQGWIGFVS